MQVNKFSCKFSVAEKIQYMLFIEQRYLQKVFPGSRVQVNRMTFQKIQLLQNLVIVRVCTIFNHLFYLLLCCQWNFLGLNITTKNQYDEIKLFQFFLFNTIARPGVMPRYGCQFVITFTQIF